MKIIADAGSTKVSWAIQLPDLNWNIVRTSGINPAVADDDTIINRLKNELMPAITGHIPSEIIYYGAGCIPSQRPRMYRLLAKATGCDKISIESDLLGAARSLCGHSAGIACILGTGSNSCYFDGHQIASSTPPLGYILGDEGSGASIGRRLIGDIFKRQLPDTVITEFHKRFQYSVSDIIERVYRMPDANKFLASFVPFVKDMIDNSEVNRMVTEEFTSFLVRNVQFYPSSPVNFTGSIAGVFRDQLLDSLGICGMIAGRIETNPIKGLIAYHS